MVIFGSWLQCDDGIVRPVIRGHVLANDDTWIATEFLVDTGADRTVFAAHFLASLKLPHVPAIEFLGGIGGVADTVMIGTQIRFAVQDAGRMLFQGKFAGFTDPNAIDMNILGRDILKLFAVIVDQPGDVVAMIGKPRRYRIE